MRGATAPTRRVRDRRWHYIKDGNDMIVDKVIYMDKELIDHKAGPLLQISFKIAGSLASH
jgi:hypothetical protein